MQTFIDKDRQLVINPLRVYVICFEYLLDRLCENIIRISLQRRLSLLYKLAFRKLYRRHKKRYSNSKYMLLVLKLHVHVHKNQHICLTT